MDLKLYVKYKYVYTCVCLYMCLYMFNAKCKGKYTDFLLTHNTVGSFVFSVFLFVHFL